MSIDLISQLKQATEKKPERLVVSDKSDDKIPAEILEDEEEAEEIFSVPGEFDDTVEKPEHEEEEIEEDLGPPSDRHVRQAKRWLRAYQSASRLILKPLYKMKFLKPGDEEYSKNFISSNKTTGVVDIPNAGTEEHKRLERYQYFLELADKIKLDEEEEEEGIEIISELIQKHKKFQMSPESSLALWGFGVVVARAEPVLPDLTKIFDSFSKKPKNEGKRELQHNTSREEEDRKVNRDPENG